jgi:hypothetical protein
LLERRIDRAKRKGRGMWALGDQRVSAADYKRGGSGSHALAQQVPLASSPSKIAVPFGQRRRSKVLDTVMTGLELGLG